MTLKINVEAQEQLAFDTLDDLLEQATWKQGLVILKTSRTVYFCYDIPKLRTDLFDIAQAAVKDKFRRCDAQLGPVVENILEEYEDELKKARIFERKIPKRFYKKAL